MSTAASIASPVSPAVWLWARPDLEIRRQRTGGRTWWVVKDPLALSYTRLPDEEHFLLTLLDGRRGLEELQTRFERRFSPRKISLVELQRFVTGLHGRGLVVAEAPGQGDALLARRQRRVRDTWRGAVANPLCIRFRGFDPTGLLNALDPLLGWMFSPLAVAATCLLFCAALAVALVRSDELAGRLPSLDEYLTPSGAFWLAAALGATKVLHELGHGLACRRFGGQCHEVGVMLLLFTPCLYCNVSDAWMLDSKWRRAMVGAAGMYVELLLASLAVLAWWSAEPGLPRQIAFNIMLVCSVSTLVLNGNPLLRYDGYYILSDLVGTPNLHQKSTALLRQAAATWFLGVPPQPDATLPTRRRALFIAYAIASAVYRSIVLLSILWFLYVTLEPLRLRIVADVLIAVTLVGIVGGSTRKLARFGRGPENLRNLNGIRPRICLGIAAALVASAFFVPLPHTVRCPVEINLRDADGAYVEVPGALTEILVRPGDRVTAGQPLVRLEDAPLAMAVAELRGSQAAARAELDALLDQRFDDRDAAARIAEVEATLARVSEQVEQRRRDQARLTIRAPRDGIVLPPAAASRQATAETRLARWSGTPLEGRNLGAFLEAGTLVCQVGDPACVWADLVVDQADIELLAEGQAVRIVLDALPHDVLHGSITVLARREMDHSPERLSARSGGELATVADESGRERPAAPSYYARVPLDDSTGVLRPGLRGHAHVRTRPRTLAERIWRAACATFSFPL